MNFKEWAKSEDFFAENYRWFLLTYGISDRDNVKEAARCAFEAGKQEGIKIGIKSLT